MNTKYKDASFDPAALKDEQDVVWDPFAGLFTTAIASFELNRTCFCAETNKEIFEIGINRIKQSLQDGF